MSKTSKKFAARSLAAAVAAVSLSASLPIAPLTQAFAAEEKVQYRFEDGLYALHTDGGSLVLNEKEVNVSGDVYSQGDFNYTGAEDKLSVSGYLLEGEDGSACDIPAFVNAVNKTAAYADTYEDDQLITSSVIDLSEESFRTDGGITITHAEITGTGNITAREDIYMELYGGNADGKEPALIMSEEGDITIDAASFGFTGVLYAPEGKVKINAKDIDFAGTIYADSIEINGTSLDVKYMDFLPDALMCRAHETESVSVRIHEQLPLSGFCNYEQAEVSYSVQEGLEEFVQLTDADTLKPMLVFTEPGEYDITLTAVFEGETASDTVKVIVADGPVVNYTLSQDFEDGDLSDISGKNEEIKLSPGKAEEIPVTETYTLGAENGITVESTLSKSSISSSGDNLTLGYSLSGYGKTETGSGSDVILLIDNSGSVSSMVPTIKETSLKILEYMGPNDRFGIASLDGVNTVLTDSKQALTEAINRYSLSGGSDYGYGLTAAMGMFDEKSTDRNKFIILLADGENSYSDDAVALNMSALAAEQGVKIYSFEINPFSTNFSDTSTMQQIAIDTKGAYKLCPDAEAISVFMLKMADAIYNLAARNITFSTTVVDSSWVDFSSLKKAPDTVVNNDDGSVTLSWKYNVFEIGGLDELGFKLKTGKLSEGGYQVITRDTTLTSYNDNGEGSIIYLDDIIVGKDNFAGKGSWSSSVYDSEIEDCSWACVKWTADYPGNSAIDVYLSVSSDGKSFSTPVRVTNGQELIGLTGRYIKTEVAMSASEDGSTPVLYDLTIYSGDEVKTTAPVSGNSVNICGGKTVYAGSTLSLWLDSLGSYDSVTDVSWEVTGASEDFVTEELGQLRRNFCFNTEGEYTITVTVTAGNITTESAINVTVLPEKKFSQSVEGEEDEFKALNMTVSETPAYMTSYQEPASFNITFEDPDLVSWVRVLYSNEKAWGTTLYQAYVDEANGNTVSISLPSNHPADTVITIQAFDWYGNMTQEIRSIRMDRSAPSVNLRSDKGSMYPGNSALITASATDNDGIASLALTCNGKPVTLNENGEYTFIPSVPGSYEFICTAIDHAGLETSRSTVVTVREDVNKPNLYLNAPSSVVYRNSGEITLSANDGQTGLASLKLTLDDGTVIASFSSADGEIPPEYTYTFTPEAVGKYVFNAEAIDNAGNISTTARTVNCVADTSRPGLKITLSNPEVIAGEQIIATVTATDNVAVTELHFFVDGVEQQLGEDGTFVYTSDETGVFEDGIKQVVFTASAMDAVENTANASATLKVLSQDETKPVITISLPEQFEYNASNAYMSVTAKDNIAVTELKVTVDGTPVELDENGRYYFDTTKLGEYKVHVTASDSSGNIAEADDSVNIVDIRKPTVSISKDKSSYSMGDNAVITVTAEDNYAVASVSATLNGVPVEAEGNPFTFTIENLQAGTYEIYASAADEFGQIGERSITITVKDTEAPVVELSSDKEKYATGETPVITCTATDNVGVTEVSAFLDGEAVGYDAEAGLLILPENIAAGDHIITVSAKDAAGNTSDEASCMIFISASSDTVNPEINSVTHDPAVLRAGNEAEITVDASDDSGEVDVTVSIDGTELEYDAINAVWKFTPEAAGEVTLTIRAEDPSGNYTISEAVLTIYRNIDGHRLKVEAPDVVKAGETFKITLSSTDTAAFEEYELSALGQNLTSMLVQNSDGSYSASLSLISAGEVQFTAVGRDFDFEDTVEFVVTVGADYKDEIKSEEMQAALAQTSETQLNDELKALAASFDTPAEAYEYVYNNIAFESYTNSRRGAVGAYELKRGNDFDQASLLIGLLREMGYPAKYGYAPALITPEQTLELMAMEDFDSASGMLASSGKKAGLITDSGTGEQYVKMEETFVMVYVPGSALGETDEAKKNLGVWARLDTSIKKSVLTEVPLSPDASDIESEAQQVFDSYSATEIGSFSKLMDGAYERTEKAYIRDIVQREFEYLPSALQYPLYSADEIQTFNEIPVSMADTVQFVVNNGVSGTNLGTYKISDIYGKRVTLHYEGNTGGGTIFDMNKNSIYKNSFLPVLSVDGVAVDRYSYSDYEDSLSDYLIDPEDEYYFLRNQSWKLGEKHTLLTRITTNGKYEDITDELIIGNTYSFVFDTGGITDSQYHDAVETAAAANGLDISNPDKPVIDKTSESYPTDTTFYDEDKIGSFLDLAGKLYFLMCDGYGTVTANTSNVEQSSYTKMLITSYTTTVYEDTLLGYATTDIAPGRFQIDVSYNTTCSFSRTGDKDARNKCMFTTAYMESYFEGWIWERLLYTPGVSTVSILEHSLNAGADLLMIDASNIDEMLAKADVTSEEETEIRTEAANGRVIFLPDQRIKINDWSGTGYIIADLENYDHFVFKISGGLNGGSGTIQIDLEDAKALFGGKTEQIFTCTFSICQSLYYFMLEKHLISDLAPAMEACTAACQSGSSAAIAATGVKLYNEVSGLVDILNYRVQLLDNLYAYCMGHEEQATVDMIMQLVDMLRDLFEISADDIRDEFLGSIGLDEDDVELFNFLRSLMQATDEELDTSFAPDDWFDLLLSTPEIELV